MNQKQLLLLCGICASVIYIGSDIVAASLWADYSYTNFSVSELRAIEAPTRSMLVPALILYSLLEIAFGFGVMQSAVDKRSIQGAGILLVLLGLLDAAAPFFPMHTRDHIQLAGRSSADLLHIAVTFATVVIIVTVIGFGANSGGKIFRLYSYGTIILMIVFGAWASMDVPQMEANLPTPGFGIKERINIYSYMVWVMLFSLRLLITPRTAETHTADKPVVQIESA